MNFLEWAAKWGVSKEAMDDWRQSITPATVDPIEGSESRAQSELRLAAVEFGSLWRNNAGVAETETRPVRYGLGNDSARWWKNWRSGDLVGITKVTVQPHHVGRDFGIFTMIEVKHPGWNPKVLNQPSNERERGQMNCLTHVASLGGIAGFATSPDDYRRFIADYIR